MKRFFYLLLALTMVSNNVMAFDYEPEEGLTYMGIFGMNVSKLQNHGYGSFPLLYCINSPPDFFLQIL